MWVHRAGYWGRVEVVDYIPHFHREVLAFGAAARSVFGADSVPMVPSCPDWSVHFDGDDVRLAESTGPCDVELAGTASDLMLLLWHRIPADRLDGMPADRDMLDRYFALVPRA